MKNDAMISFGEWQMGCESVHSSPISIRLNYLVLLVCTGNKLTEMETSFNIKFRILNRKHCEGQMSTPTLF